jgi:hypothetical protein
MRRKRKKRRRPTKEQLAKAREWQAARRYDQELHEAKKRLRICLVLMAVMAVVWLARPWLGSL